MKIAIVGGGPAGIAAALRLKEHEVTLYEASEQLGGLARSFEKDGFHVPVFYHHVVQFDHTTKRLLKETGMEEKYAKRIKMGISREDKVYELSKTKTLFWDFLSVHDKYRFGLLYIKAKLKKDWTDLEGVNAHEWLGRTVGSNVRDKIFAPLMRVKYGIPLTLISASELAERLGNEEATGVLTYPEGGFYEMYTRLQKKIEDGGNVELNAPVTKIDLSNNSLVYKKNDKEHKENFDIVINTSPLPIFLQATKGLPDTYKKQLEQIKYTSGICLSVGMNERLSEYYWLNVLDKPFGITVEHTNLADIYPWKMLWISRYAPPPELWKLNNEEISKLFAHNLQKMFPRFKTEWIEVNRTPYASPTYDINYLKYMPQPSTPVKNMYFAGVAITYPKLRSQNTAFESGFETADIILKDKQN